jgi:curli biogenesis system outer membrane secretion channel CsgG
MKNLIVTLTLIFIGTNFSFGQFFKRNSGGSPAIENYCHDLPNEEKPWMAVLNFSNKSKRGSWRWYSYRNITEGMYEQLMSRMVNTNCFQTVEKDMGALKSINEEIRGGIMGDIDQNMAIEAGKRAGAAYMITGAVTEYQEWVSREVQRPVRMVFWTANIEISLRVISTETREVVYSGEFRGNSVKVQPKIFNVMNSNDGGYFQSAAMETAIEKAMNSAVLALLENKEKFPPRPVNPTVELTKPEDCALLNTGISPRIMVVIPEEHIQQRVPDPAGETEMIKQFLEMGFNVVDQKMVATIRNSEKATLAMNDPAAAAALGRDFGAEIIIIGEAFSHEVGVSDGLQGCRARVEAKAIRTSNGQILATDGKHASGKDVSRLIAGKKALASAGEELAIYFLNQLCEKANATSDNNQVSTTSEVLIGNLNSFAEAGKMQDFIENLPKVEAVSKTISSADSQMFARFQIKHTGSMDDLMDSIMRGQTRVKLDLRNYADGKGEFMVVN